MEDMYDFSFVDFDDVTEIDKSSQKDLYVQYYNVEYSDVTTEFYKVMRERKFNVITQENDLDINHSFKFNNMWDPYTGERLEDDPYGPLHFHPVELVYYFSSKCLTELWHNEKDETGGYYGAYYGDLLGSGENLYIEGRGTYIELYLFRLPITNCYLQKDTDLSLITMGPKLNMNELQFLDDMMTQHYEKLYIKKFGTAPPSLIKMKELYDVAICNNIDLEKHGFSKDDSHLMDDATIKENKEKINRNAVDELKKLVNSK